MLVMCELWCYFIPWCAHNAAQGSPKVDYLNFTKEQTKKAIQNLTVNKILPNLFWLPIFKFMRDSQIVFSSTLWYNCTLPQILFFGMQKGSPTFKILFGINGETIKHINISNQTAFVLLFSLLLLCLWKFCVVCYSFDCIISCNVTFMLWCGVSVCMFVCLSALIVLGMLGTACFCYDHEPLIKTLSLEVVFRMCRMRHTLCSQKQNPNARGLCRKGGWTERDGSGDERTFS